jgi:hypothetical protein
MTAYQAVCTTAGVLDGVGSLPVSASDSEEWEDVV